MAVIHCILIGYYHIFARFFVERHAVNFCTSPGKLILIFSWKYTSELIVDVTNKMIVCVFNIFCSVEQSAYALVFCWATICQFIKNMRKFLVMEGQNVRKFFWNNWLFYLGCKLNVRLNIFLNTYGYFKDLIHKVVYWTYLWPVIEIGSRNFFNTLTTFAWKVSKYRVFSCIRMEYGDLWSKCQYSVRIQENTYQKRLRIWTLFMQWSPSWLGIGLSGPQHQV